MLSRVLQRLGPGWLAALVFIAAAEVPAEPPAGEARRLAPGEAVVAELGRGQAHLYDVQAAPDRHRIAIVARRDVGAQVEAWDPEGRSLGVREGPTAKRGIESVVVPAGGSGIWRIEVRAGEGRPGTYEIRVDEVAEITAGDRERLAAERAGSEASRLAATGTAEGRREAAARYEESASHWRAIGETAREAWALQAAGVLRILLGELRPALATFTEALSRFELQGDPLGQADALTGIGLMQSQLGDFAAARNAGQQALALQTEHADHYGAARTENNLCLIRQAQGELRDAAACHERVAARYRDLGETAEVARSLTNLAGVQELLGDVPGAEAGYQEALALVRSLAERRLEGQVLNNLAVLELGIGEVGQALSHAEEALAIFHALGDRAWQARARHNLGDAYWRLGAVERARGQLEQAAGLRREIGDARGEAVTLNLLGMIDRELGEEGRAGEAHARALELARSLRLRREEGLSLLLLGRQRSRIGESAEALALLGQAASLLKEIGEARLLSTALHATGEAYLTAGDLPRASSLLTEALELRRSLRSRRGEVETLTALASIDQRSGRFPEALARIGEAIRQVEELRVEIDPPDLRAAYFGRLRRTYETAVDLRMDLHLREPGAGHARTALEMAERSRARALLELLGEAREGALLDGAPALLERRRSVLLRLARQASRGAAEAGDVQALLAELDAIEAEARRTSPRYAALVRPEPLRAEEIQRLVGPDTLLLEIFLGDRRSFLWAVDQGSVQVFELPARNEIETLARQVYEDLSRFRQGASREERTAMADRRLRLSRLVLGPVAERLGERRLVLVADGALQYIPFAALPEPGGAEGAGPLLVRHEVVALPSASVLAELRSAQAARTRAPRMLAVLADPVFSAADPRLGARGSSAAALAASDPVRGSAGERPRLESTRQEALAIASLVPPEQTLLALDFDASRETALGGGLAGYRILHFATHGILDAQTPELSGLALSELDAAGRPRAGFLGLADVYGLRLSAELVVLSGCETALGREVRGEGLLGLTRGFLYAGASRVMASLWNVRDRATAELMEAFYRELLQNGRPPAAALREAQLSLLRTPRWRDPYFWAPFVLQGDWLQFPIGPHHLSNGHDPSFERRGI